MSKDVPDIDVGDMVGLSRGKPQKGGADMREVFRMVRDRKSRLYGFNVMWTYVPEHPQVLYFVDRHNRVVYINKGAHEGAGVVSLI